MLILIFVSKTKINTILTFVLLYLKINNYEYRNKKFRA